MAYFLLYDEDCSLCVRFKSGIKRLDKQDQIEPIGFMDPRIPKVAPGMSREDLMNSFHLVLPDGKVLSGNRAMPTLLSLLPGWGFLGWLLKCLPGARRIGDKLYLWIAAHRK